MPRVSYLCLAGVLLATGCAAVRHGYADDPLLQGRKPVDGKPGQRQTDLMARAEPSAPTLPHIAYADLPQPSEPLAHVDRPAVISNPLAQAPAPSSGVEASAAAAASSPTPKRTPVPGVLVSRSKRAPEPAHAPDFAWIQGVLRVDSEGGFHLRYGNARPGALRSPGADPNDAGEIALTNDDSLKAFRDGDIVFVEGEIIHGRDSGNGSSRTPRYRVRQAWLVHRNLARDKG